MRLKCQLSEIIACPLCKGKLDYDSKSNELICKFDKLAFPIQEDGAPVMLVELAKSLASYSIVSELPVCAAIKML